MEVYRKVKDFLCDHIGNMTTPGTPLNIPIPKTWFIENVNELSASFIYQFTLLIDSGTKR
jgi:hypothetical protein